MPQIKQLLDGERVTIICSINDVLSSASTVILYNSIGNKVVESSQVLFPRGCFSIPRIAFILLPVGISYESVKNYTDFECVI